jgi:hypothetical protein
MFAWPGWFRKGKFVGPQILVIAFHVGAASNMARSRRWQRQEMSAKPAFVGSAIGPKGPPWLRIRPKAFVARHIVLEDESLDPLRMGQGHAETHGAAVILHVQRASRELERFGEVIHDVGVTIEFFWGWPVAALCRSQIDVEVGNRRNRSIAAEALKQLWNMGLRSSTESSRGAFGNKRALRSHSSRLSASSFVVAYF